MGYTTDFGGSFDITPKPSEAFEEKFNSWKDTRKVTIDVSKLPKEVLENASKYTLFGDFGPGGAFAIDIQDMYADYMVNYNGNDSLPGIWCQWEIEDGVLQWDQGEKFYHYIDWLSWLIENVFKRQGFTLNGSCKWWGEEYEDHGEIRVTDNKIEYSDFASGVEKFYSVDMVDGEIKHTEIKISVADKFRNFLNELSKEERDSKLATKVDNVIKSEATIIDYDNFSFVKFGDEAEMLHTETLEILAREVDDINFKNIMLHIIKIGKQAKDD